MFDVVGLGVSTVDLLLVVDELPGSELVQRAEASAVAGGGPIATAMVALSRLGASSAMLDRIGDDIFGRMILDGFRCQGVNTDGIVVEQGKSSSHASILVRRRDGARAITFSPGDCGDLARGEVREDLIRAARFLHVNGRHWDACLHAVRTAKAAGVPVSFDGGAHRYQPQHHELIPLVDICIVAQQYAAACTGEDGTDAAAEALLRQGAQIVVVTQGTAGSRVYSRQGERFHQRAYQVDEVVDSTGAGDAYHGAFLFGLSRGFSLRQSASYASAAGALSTRALGGRSALPSLPELQHFLAGTPHS